MSEPRLPAHLVELLVELLELIPVSHLEGLFSELRDRLRQAEARKENVQPQVDVYVHRGRFRVFGWNPDKRI